METTIWFMNFRFSLNFAAYVFIIKSCYGLIVNSVLSFMIKFILLYYTYIYNFQRLWCPESKSRTCRQWENIKPRSMAMASSVQYSLLIASFLWWYIDPSTICIDSCALCWEICQVPTIPFHNHTRWKELDKVSVDSTIIFYELNKKWYFYSTFLENVFRSISDVLKYVNFLSNFIWFKHVINARIHWGTC